MVEAGERRRTGCDPAGPLRSDKMTALETAATYGTTTEDEVTEQILFPDGMRGDVGGVSVVASPSVIGGVEGAFST